MIRRTFRRLYHWIDDTLPAQCPICGNWQQKKLMQSAPHRTTGWIEICQPCHSRLYPKGFTQ